MAGGATREVDYNDQMHTFSNRVRVTAARASEHVQEIRFRVGDSLAVGRRNQQHPAFVSCTTEDGHCGSVPEEYIEMVGTADAVARRDYDSTHLTATAGELLGVLEQVGDFLLCQNAGGAHGWVPASSVEEIPEES